MAEFLRDNRSPSQPYSPSEAAMRIYSSGRDDGTRTSTFSAKREKGFSPRSTLSSSSRQSISTKSFEKGARAPDHLNDLDTKVAVYRRGSEDALDFLLSADWLNDDFGSPSSMVAAQDLLLGSASNVSSTSVLQRNTAQLEPSPLSSPLSSPSSASNANGFMSDFFVTSNDRNMMDMSPRNSSNSLLEVDRSSDLSMLSFGGGGGGESGDEGNEGQFEIALEQLNTHSSRTSAENMGSRGQTSSSAQGSSSRRNQASSIFHGSDFGAIEYLDGTEQDPLLIPTQTLNINEILSSAEQLALARPLINEEGQVILGTWNPEHEMVSGDGSGEDGSTQTIVCGQLQKAWTSASKGVLKDVTSHLDDGSAKSNKFAMHITAQHQVPGNVADMKWFDGSSVAVACGTDVSLVTVHGSQHNVFGSSMGVQQLHLPHINTIREVAVSDRRVLTGGFDGSLCVCHVATTGEARVTCEIQTDEVVGSVKWHPTQRSVFSCTQDRGTVLLYDLRASGGKQVAMYESMMSDGFTHSYDGENSIVMGFAASGPADWHLQFIDLRMDLIGKKKKKGKPSFPMQTKHNTQDPHMYAVGDILIAPGSRIGRRYFLFGQPGFSVHDGRDTCSAQNLASAGHYSTNYDELSMIGCIIPGTKSQGVFTTDGLGNINLFNMQQHLSWLPAAERNPATYSGL
jgi:hypothetical protein